MRDQAKALRVKWRKWTYLPPLLVLAVFWALPSAYHIYSPFVVVFAFVLFVVPQMVSHIIEDKRIDAWLDTLSSKELNKMIDTYGEGRAVIRIYWLVQARKRAEARELAAIRPGGGTQEV